MLLVAADSPIHDVKTLWAEGTIKEGLLLPAGSTTLVEYFECHLRALRVAWRPTDYLPLQDAARMVARRHSIAFSLNEPNLVNIPGVRVVGLPHFEPVPIGVIWREPAAAHVKQVIRLFEQRAREFWPDGMA